MSLLFVLQQKSINLIDVFIEEPVDYSLIRNVRQRLQWLEEVNLFIIERGEKQGIQNILKGGI